jgi:hypothetical protein
MGMLDVFLKGEELERGEWGDVARGGGGDGGEEDG